MIRYDSGIWENGFLLGYVAGGVAGVVTSAVWSWEHGVFAVGVASAWMWLVWRKSHDNSHDKGR